MGKHGVLLAVSSLPGKYGVGDFSDEAYKFINVLKNHNVDLWQILPLNPIGYGHSPYQPFSSYAFDEIYISIEDLQKRGLLGRVNKVRARSMADYEKARYIKEQAIWKAFEVFKQNPKNMAKLDKFIKENPYIEEYAEFITLKEFNCGYSWNEWRFFAKDRPEDFAYLKAKHAFAQMILTEEWNKIRAYANKRNIQIIGDVPFYVGYDSSDVYFHKESFMLDKENKPSCIAGVPPDYFSEDGQRWGNPIWNWDYLYQSDFKAMMDRLYFASKFYDIVRLDHFRAFDSYWAINPECPTAKDGEWRYPDGYRFFRRFFEKYPHVQLIVEDLGDLRPEVLYLRDTFMLAGMREVEFTIFEDEFENKRIEKENMVYYTSTHDNETLAEWIANLPKDKRIKLNKRMDELGITGKNLCEKLIKYAYRRKERIVIASVSDILNLNKTHRMNIPGIVNDVNWRFKLQGFRQLGKQLSKFF